MQNTHQPILITIAAIARSHQKGYCYPSQQTILDLLCKHHAITISRRTLNRHLENLEARGYFQRVRRIKKEHASTKRFRSTLYILKAKLYKHLKSLQQFGSRFFSCFRVPFMAHHQAKRQASSGLESLNNPPTVDHPKELTPSEGQRNIIHAQNLLKLREIIAKI